MRFSKSTDEYERLAPVYDSLVGPFIMPIRREVCRIARANRFESILDICCGTGQQAIMLARSGFHVTGIDLSAAMIEVARAKSPQQVKYYLEDAANLHFEDNAFDCAIISFALHEKDPVTRGRIMREAQRVLANDGQIVIVDYMAPRSYTARIGSKLIGMVEWLAGVEHYTNFKHYMQQGATAALLREHRLAPIRVVGYHLGAIALIQAKWPA